MGRVLQNSRVGTSVGHGKQTRLVVLQDLGRLIGELLAVDGLATGTLKESQLQAWEYRLNDVPYVTAGEVTTLEHEIGDDSVESRACVSGLFIGLTLNETSDTVAELSEVLDGDGLDVVEQVEVDTSGLLCIGKLVSTNGDRIEAD